MATIRCAVLLLFATSVAAAQDPSTELLTVRTVKVCSSGGKASQDANKKESTAFSELAASFTINQALEKMAEAASGARD